MNLIENIDKLFNINEKIAIINYCEIEFGDNYGPIWLKEELEEMIIEEGFNKKEVEECLPNIKNEKYILIQGRSFEGCNESYINEEFKQQIQQNISNNELKEQLIDILIFKNNSDELINKIEEE